MIGMLEGTVGLVTEHAIMVMTNGIGWQVHVPTPSAYPLSHVVKLYIHTLFREQEGIVLYGFTTHDEYKLFMLLLECSGCGPKLSMAILQQLTAEQILRALVQGDTKTLSSISGIGGKKAENLVFHLKDKAQVLMASGSFGLLSQEGSNHGVWRDVSQSLTALGYSSSEVSRAMGSLMNLSKSKTDESFDYIMRSALQFLASERGLS
jgi:Holliday junction DNA helicase RuvA